MERHEEPVLLRAEPQQQGATDWTPDEIERPARLLARPPLRFSLPLSFGQRREIDQRERQRIQGLDPLSRLAFPEKKDRAQDLVPSQDLPQRRGEDRRIERACQTELTRYVVDRRARLELLQEPHPALSEGERQRLPGNARRAPDRRRRRRPRRAADPLRQPRHGGRPEQGAQRQIDTDYVGHLSDDADGEERMPSQGEEVVVDADPLMPEQAGPDPGQQLLVRRQIG